MPKKCSITAEQQRRADAMAKKALDRAQATGSTTKLEAIATRSERLMQAWIAAGRPNSKRAVDLVIRQVDGPAR